MRAISSSTAATPTSTIRFAARAEVEALGKYFIGAGISGGEEGARYGPSIMPGGSPPAWESVKPILQAVAAKVPDGTPCCDWVGEDGAGHFVKMVHNGIEYGDMQLICEAYHLMSAVLGLDEGEISAVFSKRWNTGQAGILPDRDHGRDPGLCG